ncbi:MAG: hypothetical protein ACLF0G_08730 [Candidatus Brocadiia bacterium]
MGRDRELLARVTGVLGLAAGAVGLAVCLLVPAPDQLAEGLAGELDAAFGQARRRIRAEVEALEDQARAAPTSEVREAAEARIAQLRAWRLPDARAAFERLRGLGGWYAGVRFLGLVASVAMGAGGWALAWGRGAWVRGVGTVAGVLGIAVTLVFTGINVFGAAPALGEAAGRLLAGLSLPDVAVPRPELGRAAGWAAGLAASAVVGLACLPYPLLLVVVGSTSGEERGVRRLG